VYLQSPGLYVTVPL